MVQERYGRQYGTVEWSYTSQTVYADPFNEVDLSLIVTDPQGDEWRVPAFWSGGHDWRVRFTPRRAGTYLYRTACSDSDNGSLHGLQGQLQVVPHQGDTELARRGPLRVSEGHRHLQHLDGTPFFWLADTWWLGLSSRLSWPTEFQTLVSDRAAKGFTVIQLVAGLFPDMAAFDRRGVNEAGFPWEDGFARINPAYFGLADLRIQRLVDAGLVPCILGAWGYYLRWMGTEKMKQHWRNLVARYSAYPVIWCLAGEATMPYYLSTEREEDARMLRRGWSELARYLRAIDPCHHPITIHPPAFATGRELIEDAGLLDLDMVQGGQNGSFDVGASVAHVARAATREPRLPAISGEACYEGIMERSREEVQRALFWGAMLSGTAGYTYGANGVWQLNRPDDPFGPSPYGVTWGDRPWQEAYQLPGSRQVGVGRRVLERYPWWRFEPHAEWITLEARAGQAPIGPYGAGIPGEIRVFYFPDPITPWTPPATVKELEEDVAYSASYIDPRDGRTFALGPVAANAGAWRVPVPPAMQDWVLVLVRDTSD